MRVTNWIFSLTVGVLALSTGQSLLPETLLTETQCKDLTLSAQCQTSEQMIVHDVNRGAKPTADSCPTTYTTFDGTCCVHAAGDCMVQHDSIGTFRDACNGKTSCGDTGAVDSVLSSGCDGTIAALTNYLQLEYYCISDTLIASLCPLSPISITESSGKAVYIQNRQYPNPTPNTDTSCSCSVETNKCDDTIKFYTVHIAPFQEAGTCKQSVTVTDGTSTTEYACDTSTDYTVNIVQSTGSYLTVTLQNSATVDGGYAVAAFQALGSGATLKVDCPAAAQTYCTTTTAPPTTATATTIAAPSGSGPSTTVTSTPVVVCAIAASALALVAGLR